MKLSLWQQFSSNHSNDFAIVGQFKSVDEATAAARELSHILKTIYGWYEAHPTSKEPRYENQRYIPTAIEQQIATQYGVQWNGFHEWILYHANPEVYLTRLDQYLFINSPQTWSGYEPFDALLGKMGAQVNTQSELDEKRIYVNLTVVAPNAETATSLANAIQDYLGVNYRYLHRYQDPANYDPNLPFPPPPWVLYAPKRPPLSDDEIMETRESFNRYTQQVKNLGDQWQQIKMAGAADNDPRLSSIDQAIAELRANLPIEVSNAALWYMQNAMETAPTVHGSYETISVDAERFRAENLRFTKLGNGLPAITGWLRAQGCEVEFEFHEDAYPD